LQRCQKKSPQGSRKVATPAEIVATSAVKVPALAEIVPALEVKVGQLGRIVPINKLADVSAQGDYHGYTEKETSGEKIHHREETHREEKHGEAVRRTAKTRDKEIHHGEESPDKKTHNQGKEQSHGG